MNELISENVAISDEALLTSKELYKRKKFTPKYYQLYRNYKILLDKYLLEKLELLSFDKSFDDSGLNFIPVKQENMDYYQYVSAMGLKYIYLRSNIYVEKLPNEYIDKLLSLGPEDLKKTIPEIFKIIENTFKDVIDVNTNKDIISMACYGPDDDHYWFPSNELIIGFRHDDFADNGLGKGDEWAENNTKQIMFINVLKDELSERASEILEMPVNVVWYNDFTIKEVVNVKK